MDWTTPFLWIANGALVSAYVLYEHAAFVLLLIPLLWFWLKLGDLAGSLSERAMRPALAAAVLLSLLSCAFSPQPVPWLLLVMAGSGLAAAHLETYRTEEVCWTAVQGLILYSLLGLAGAAFLHYQQLQSLSAQSELLLMGSQYLSVLLSVALWGLPAGFLVMLVKNLLIHPPLPGGSPQQLASSIRTRGRKS